MIRKKRKIAKTAPAKSGPRITIQRWLPIGITAALTAAFILLAAGQVPFLQDDAYISFRYVQNYLNGDGLVFNAGERIEGYTNFLWVILLALTANFGYDLPETARWLGILVSAGAVVATFLLARRVLSGFTARWVSIGALIAAAWVAVNPAVHYWSVAGLETGLFTFLVTCALERLLAGSALSWNLLALATLTRPEGGLIFVICAGWYVSRDISSFKRRWQQPAMYYVLPLVPFALFKLYYYGSLFPNPFYAKTGFSPEYWQSGIGYLWLYLQHFGLWGLLPGVMVLGVFRARWKASLGLMAIVWLVYTMYIVSIGGDVLRAHRFFVPVWPVFAVAVIGAVVTLAHTLHRKTIILWGTAIIGAGIAAYQWFYPQEYFLTSRGLELSIVEKMRSVASLLKGTDNRNFSICASTIGRLGYDLEGHTLIDMLGLTDSTVARHPETIPGMETTWKERNFNAGYILSRDPDYILFSTGYKPSAPAERALILHSKFRQNYFVALYPAQHLNRNLAVHKRIGEFTKPDSVWPDLQLANDLNEGLNQSLAGNYEQCIETLTRMKHNGPGDYAEPDNHMAVACLRLKQPQRALAYADSALAINPTCVAALGAKYDAYGMLADTAMMVTTSQAVADICPWLVVPKF